MSNHDLEARLNRVKHLITEPDQVAVGDRTPARYNKMAAHTGGELLTNETGTFCRIKTEYSGGYRFGDRMLEVKNVPADVPLSCYTAGIVEGTASLSELLFFDLETTGLGGSGVVPFLVGCGSLTPDGFEVRQYLLPDYSDERAMLEHLKTEISPERTLVSYNGAAFDLNLLRDRFIMNRVGREIEVKNHVDLLHSTRRLYRRRLRDCSLTNVERELFGFFRQNDIPGYLIPSVYFAWLGEDRLDEMDEVLEHNRLDIIALFFLFNQIASVFATEGDDLSEVDDIYSLSRVYGRRKLNDKVIGLLDGISGHGSKPEVLLFRALALKRAGCWERSVLLWKQLSGEDSREGYLANIELAKYFEHRGKDPAQALIHADRANSICPGSKSQKMDLERRLSRLNLKLP
jgi:uncharacterized protein YprB with RNaseH-like and TPR domain